MADCSVLLKSTCARTPMAAIRRNRWVTWRAGTSPRRFGTAVSAADFFLPRKIGPEATGALKWHRTRGSTTNSRKPATKPWALRSLTGACTIVSRFSFGFQIAVHPEVWAANRIGTHKSASGPSRSRGTQLLARTYIVENRGCDPPFRTIRRRKRVVPVDFAREVHRRGHCEKTHDRANQ